MFTDEFRLFSQEAMLTRSCLAADLTALRNANLDNLGAYLRPS